MSKKHHKEVFETSYMNILIQTIGDSLSNILWEYSRILQFLQ